MKSAFSKNYLAFQPFKFERTQFDIYVFIFD